MKKLLGLLSVGIIAVGLAGCGNNNSTGKDNNSSDLELTKTELQADYNDIGAAVISTLKKVSTDSLTSEARSQLTEVRSIKSELNKNTSHKKITNALIKYASTAQKSIISMRDDTDTKTDGATFGDQTDKLAKKYFNNKLPKAYQDYLDSFNSSSESDNTTASENSSSDSTSNDTYSSVKNYNVNWSDNSWAGLNISIDKVDVGALKSPEETTDNAEANGIIRVHFTINNTQRDLSTYPNQATLQTSDGQQIDADLSDSDDIGGDFMQGTQKDGYVYFLVPTLGNASDITNIRLKFDGDYDTDNYEDDNSMHSFDTGIINLN
jgi:hypothetical protein